LARPQTETITTATATAASAKNSKAEIARKTGQKGGSSRRSSSGKQPKRQKAKALAAAAENNKQRQQQLAQSAVGVGSYLCVGPSNMGGRRGLRESHFVRAAGLDCHCLLCHPQDPL